MVQRKFQEAVRRMPGLTIYFRDKHTVLVYYDHGVVIFHRWFDRHRGSYQTNWLPFVMALRQSNSIESIWKVYQLADRYDVEHISAQANYRISETAKELPARHLKKRKPL